MIVTPVRNVLFAYVSQLGSYIIGGGGGRSKTMAPFMTFVFWYFAVYFL